MLLPGFLRSVRLGFSIPLVSLAALFCCAQTGELNSYRASVNDPLLATVRKEVLEVNLILTVTDRHRHFVENLTPAEIMIRDNGAPPAKITYFEAQTRLPLRVALVIDASDSVAYYFDSEKYTAKAFLARILKNASDLAMIVVFNEKAHIVQDPTRDRNLLSHAIAKLPRGGNTSIYDAVALASQQLGTIDDSGPSRRAIILITDGADNSSERSLQDAAAIAQQNQTIIYVLNTGTRYSDSKPAEEAMKQLSEITGGECLRADNDYVITRAFSKMETELRSQYAIGYKPSNTTPDGSFHQISVFAPKDLVVRHRHGYFAK